MKIVNLITEHIDIWTAPQTLKVNGGRGRGKNSNGQSPHGINKLRELILELAVRGNLVAQDPNDVPASVLLEKIAEEKAQLIKKGIIKKQKPLPEISEDEKPFELPEGWEWVRLGEVGNIFNGNSISASVKEAKYTNIEGELSFIATKDVGYGWEELDYGNGISIPKDEPKFKVAHKGAVLICAEGGSAGKKCGITNQDICFGNKLFTNDLYGNIESSYILANYLSPTFFNQFSDKMTGIIGGISASKFSQLLLPIPPLAEQSRIVVKVNGLMALCDQLEQRQTDSHAAHETLVETLLATLTSVADQGKFAKAWQRIADHFDTLFITEHSIDQLKQTILQLAVMGKLVPQDPNDEPASVLLENIAEKKVRLVNESKIKKQKPLLEIGEDEKPFELPDGWEWARIGDASLFTEYGMSEKTFDGINGIPVLKMGDIQDGKVILGGQKLVPENMEGLPSLYLKKWDVLYNRTNSAELVGKTGIYDGPDDAYTFASYLVRIRCSEECVHPIYLNLSMNTTLFRLTQIEPHLKQQCGQANVNATIMKNMIVPVPPIHEQHRIVAKVDELMVLCDTMKARVNEAQATQVQLADAIVQQAVA